MGWPTKISIDCSALQANKRDHQKIHEVIKTALLLKYIYLFSYLDIPCLKKILNEKYTTRSPLKLIRCRSNLSRTCAFRVGAFSALRPMSSALRSPMSSRWALPLPLLRSVGTGHRAIAPRTPLLPLPVHWGPHVECKNSIPNGEEKYCREK